MRPLLGVEYRKVWAVMIGNLILLIVNYLRKTRAVGFVLPVSARAL